MDISRTNGELIMLKLTDKERAVFENILDSDLGAINAKFMNQIKDFWGLARERLQIKKGFDKLEIEKNKLNEGIKLMKDRIAEIENSMHTEKLLPEQIIELGGNANNYGAFRGANFYGIPVESQFDYEIVEFIRDNIDIEVPAEVIRDICLSVKRELAMCGTFETAKEAYEKFYSPDFRKYGVDIPLRLDEVRNNKKLLEFAGKSLNQINNVNNSKVESEE